MDAGEVVVTIMAETAGLTAGLSEAEGSLERFGSVMTGMASAAAVGLGYAIVDGIGDSINALAELEGTTTRASFSFNEAGVDAQALAKDIREMTQQDDEPLEEVAASVQRLGQLGYTTAEATDMMSTAFSLADGTGGELAAVTDSLARTLKIFNKDASETNQVADVMQEAYNHAGISTSELTQAFGRMAPYIKQNNLDLNDLTVVLSAGVRSGLNFGQSVTSLTMMLRELAAPSDKAKQAFSDMGVTLDEVNPKYHKISDILRTLKEHGMTQEQAEAIFGARGMALALSLTDPLNTDLGDIESAFGDVEGASKRAGDAMAETFDERWGNFINKIKEIGLAIGEHLMPFLTAAAQVLGELVDDITGSDLSGADIKLSNGMVIPKDQFNPDWTYDTPEGPKTGREILDTGLGQPFKDLKQQTEELTAKFRELKGKLEEILGLFGVGPKGEERAKEGKKPIVDMEGEMGALDHLLHPERWSLKDVTENNDFARFFKGGGLRDFLGTKKIDFYTMDDLSRDMAGFNPAKFMEKLGAGLSGFKMPEIKLPGLDRLKSDWDQLTGWFKNIKLPQLPKIDLSGLSSGIQSFVGGLTSGASQLVGTASSWVTSFVNGLVTGAVQLINTALSWITTFVSGLVTGAMQLINTAISWVTTFVSGLVAGAMQLINTAISWVTTFVSGLVAGAMQLINTAISWVTTFVSGLVTGAIQLITTAISWVTTFVSGLVTGAMQLITTAIQWVTTFISGLVTGAMQLITTAIQWVTTFITGLVTGAMQLITTAIQWVTTFITGLAQGVAQLINSAIQWVSTFIGGIAQGVGQLISQAAQWVSSFIGGIANGVGRLIDQAGQWVSSFISGITNGIGRVADAAGQIINAVIGAITGGIGRIGEAAGGIVNSIKGMLHLATGGYVSRPTMAVVGDVPGGEWIFNKGQLQSLTAGLLGWGASTAMSGGGRGGSTIYVEVTGANPLDIWNEFEHRLRTKGVSF